MREIKFRQALFEENGMFMRFHYWGFDDDGIFTAPAGNLNEHEKKVGHQQYIGLKDRKISEIYKGDILSKRAFNGDKEYTLITEVVFDNGGFCLKKLSGSPKSENGILMSFPNDMPTIIGNIYQNQELLNQ